jgi:hypothetical protein
MRAMVFAILASFRWRHFRRSRHFGPQAIATMTVFLYRRRDGNRSRVVELAIAAVGVACIGVAIAANQGWLDQHFLPSFFVPRDWYVRAETAVRAALALGGICLLLIARRVGRFVTRSHGRVVSVVGAAMLALVAGEIVLRRAPPRPLGWLVPNEEPRRQPDARLGWVLAPGRVGTDARGGRTVEYAIDTNGYRVRRLDEPVDPARPTVLFVGESVMFGEGLAWDDTIPAHVGAMLHVQSANLAVHGYSTDQAYLRLAREFPAFRQPLAVVSLFMTSLFGRNLDDERPHLGPGLAWLPAEHPPRLMSLVGLLVPYRRDTTVEAGIRMTRDVLRATAALAAARGAAALVVIPRLGAEPAPEQALRHRVFDGIDVPNVFLEIDPSWHLRRDPHPDARAAKLIADAVAAQLRIR